MNNSQTILHNLWNELYQNQNIELLQKFIEEISLVEKSFKDKSNDAQWYKNAVVYSLYVDLFNNDFKGLESRLDYLSNLGITCLWLLPILESPMKDAGFDISDYKKIRPNLTGLKEAFSEDQQLEVFKSFLAKAKQRGIKVIFDIAINHTSVQHYWFIESRKSTENPYRDYYIWHKDDQKYKEARLLFKGMCPSNWEKDGEWYYFHRFFEFQPDLNYRNPKVLIEMAGNLVFWLKQGVDGFRADAIPYLWKEEGTNCENLPKTHTIVKFFRAVLDYIKPGTILLAEACQKPHEIVKYFGNGDECHAGYHFPLMPQIFKAIGKKSSEPIKETLSPKITPEIMEGCQWFTFLRCHDELSLESVYVSEQDRKFIHETYCHSPNWDFRLGEGISARLAELMRKNPNKIALAFAIILSLPGTPVIYYGDEFGKENDVNYYKEQIKLSGKNDTRFLVRGRIDWNDLNQQLNNPESIESDIFNKVSVMINIRNLYKNFGQGGIEWLNNNQPDELLIFKRNFKSSEILIICNLSDQSCEFNPSEIKGLKHSKDLVGNKIMFTDENILIAPFEYHWIILKE